jgi:glyoxylase-like metal-dependent hydrolase (beta-lactamase superfamily II)
MGVLVCGDYLSPVEIPWISEGGSVTAYLATLDRLHELVTRAQTVVPGHGGPVERDRALEILGEDAEYLQALLTDGENATLPAGRRTGAQRKIHAENATRTPS